MLKTILAGMAALTIVGTSLAIAEQSSRFDAPRYRPTAEDMAALAEARIAALKAGLKLTAEQEKNWPAVEAAIRGLAKQRADRIAEVRAQREARSRDARRPRRDTIERLRRSASEMNTRAAALTRLADAAEPLYNSLDEGQKHRFALLLRMGRGYGPVGHHRWQRRADLGR
jgi:hypothetical protein